MRVGKILIVLAASAFSTLAAAGMRTNVATYVSDTFIQASLSSARYGSGTLEYLFCDSYSSGYIYCSARDAAGVSNYCSTSASGNPAFAQALHGMNSASFAHVHEHPGPQRIQLSALR
jgi:hypothetical protein